jgi:drug/metabolite transporter (DMT)-like permease
VPATTEIGAEVQPLARNSFFDKFATPDLTMVIVVLIWGGNFAVLKTAYAQIAPFPFTAIRFALATVLMLLLLWRREGDCRFPPGSFWKFFWLGIAGNTIYQALFANGLARTTTANSSLIVASTPVMMALAGGLIGLERITRWTVLGLALTTGGILIVVGTRGAALSSQTMIGDLMIMVSCVCWTAYVLGMRTVGKGISSLRATTLTLVTGTPGLVLFGLPGLRQTDWSQISGVALFDVFYSAGLSLVMCYLLYNRSVRLIGGVKTTIYTCMIPVVAVLIAWPVLGEKPTWLQAAGAVLIIAGVLVTRRR